MNSNSFTNSTSDHDDDTDSQVRGAGKSGRVIEKLMQENDRLRRELRSETAKREEEVKRGEAARLAKDSLQSINENLVHQTNIDKTSIARKERKIEELKSEKDENVSKRTEAEANLKKYVSETNDVVQTMKETLSSETFERERSQRQYDTLQQSWKHLEEGYRTSLSRLKKHIEEIHEERKKDRIAVQKLEVIVEQQRQEIEKMRAAKSKITVAYEDKMKEVDQTLASIRQLSSADTGQTEEALEEARRVVGELKHLLNVRMTLRDDDLLSSSSASDERQGT